VVKIIVISLATPLFDLKLVHAAINANNVIFDGNSTRDRDDLGYTPDEAISCVAKLTVNNFCKSESYLADVYKMQHNHNGCIDPLYIKLRLRNSGCLILSFHLDR
jgi:hypothetical protein